MLACLLSCRHPITLNLPRHGAGKGCLETPPWLRVFARYYYDDLQPALHRPLTLALDYENAPDSPKFSTDIIARYILVSPFVNTLAIIAKSPADAAI